MEEKNGMVSAKIPQIDAKFRECKADLDEKASDKCDFAGNILICADIVGGELASRSEAEFNRLGCNSKIETCGETAFGKCPLEPSCKGIGFLAMCFLSYDCDKYDALLNKYIKKCQNTCDVISSNCGKTPTLNGTDRNKCSQLYKYMKCVYGEQCPVSSDVKKTYADLQCGKMCPQCPLNIERSMSEKDKCTSWSKYFSCFKRKKCELLEEDIRDYILLNCDERCKVRQIPGDFDMEKDRKKGCEDIGRKLSGLELFECPILQVLKDYSSHYDCDKSCNVDELDSCREHTVPIVNSTRDEACSFYGHYMDCSKSAKCQNDTNVEIYFQNLECGAGNLSFLVAIMISMIVSFQMLDTYFGNY